MGKQNYYLAHFSSVISKQVRTLVFYMLNLSRTSRTTRENNLRTLEFIDKTRDPISDMAEIIL